MFEMANAPLPCSPPRRESREEASPSSPALRDGRPALPGPAGSRVPPAPPCAQPRSSRRSHGLRGARSRGPAGRGRRAAGGLGLPRARGARPAPSRRHLATLTCLKLFINSPGAARLRPRLLRPGGLAPPRGAHAKQINMPWLTHASQPADWVSAAPCGN